MTVTPAAAPIQEARPDRPLPVAAKFSGHGVTHVRPKHSANFKENRLRRVFS